MLVGGGARVGGPLGIVLVILVGLTGAAAVPAQGLTRTYPKVLPPKGAPVPPSHHSGVFRRILHRTSHQIARKPAV
ncbi:hypothetical protein FRC0036_00670 [Corynebacterium diphtheriae]|nr:hypothetical protein CIP107507_00532 [Corynebacterium diphtheriae]CAB0496362.1 hypothetical protein CIP107505_00559 [Corynebacterium diphtheriae]CAB0497233.1 hypothetical protein CIP107502_00605 [Corynebacterium diphtheriae]CAB0682694.1 hypothetical protein FRC0069_00551 [Corynebacterium diphtheriae]CAB0684774.1 hypothetical protein FRC0030_00671 [Corynebacterium diphtheriae]